MYYPNASIVTFHCDGGYTLFGSPTITCHDSLWKTHVPSCEGKFLNKCFKYCCWSFALTRLCEFGELGLQKLYNYGPYLTMDHFLSWLIFYHGPFFTMTNFLPWPIFYHSPFFTTAHFLPWPISYHGPFLIMAHFLIWPITWYGLFF